ncbi:extracellular solute-binding protein [Devosia rhodophyticola]|uniref:Extracellular solute-binding protein n=1 Tax=Devosia rhodophyticola TaxID=3026423 RepID=A0ABY7YU93_9HYPH|nr:extracellular solute-binding protein [Devosia rhodophyticola]WDR04772.1 extracellular solute-binding protein [Devosia rhodophyticola]
MRKSILAMAMGAMVLTTGMVHAQEKTFNIWWFEDADSAEGIAWSHALDELRANHPDVTVNFEQKTFAQLQASGSMILNSSQAPDLLEYNKGNATAGLVSSQGLLLPLDDAFTAQGWDKILNEGDVVLSKYDEMGIYGSGHIWGISVYGEYVSAFYNVDMFDKAGLTVPTTMDELVADFEAFKVQGIIPLALGGADTSGQHVLASLAYTKADDAWIQNYQGLRAPLDTAPFLYAAQTMVDWVANGYVSKDSTGMNDDDAALQFMSGKAPIYISGTWNLGKFNSNIKDFKWGQFLVPTPKYSVGSTGNLWVVPKGSKNVELAEEFISLTLSPKYQTEMANAGGVAIAADPATITNPVGKNAASVFKEISDKNGLGFYPDWPVPGFYDVLIQKVAGLLQGTSTPDEFVAQLKQVYDDAQENQ